MLRSPNPLHMYEFGDANIFHTRLRLGMSCLRAHLFTHDLIDNPMCGCGLGIETTEHYILRCPTFGVAHIEMYKVMVEILDNHLPRPFDKIIKTIGQGQGNLGKWRD